MNGVSLYMRRLVGQQRDRLLRRIDSIHGRPYALDRTKKLWFKDDWTSDSGLVGFGGFAPDTGKSAEELLPPLLSRLCVLIFRCPLESLHFHSSEFVGFIWDAARSSRTLRTLIINARIQENPAHWFVLAFSRRIAFDESGAQVTSTDHREPEPPPQ